MPHIDISLYPGRSPELKQEMARKIAGLFFDEFKFPVGSVSVSFTEIGKESFVEEVLKKNRIEDVVVKSTLIK